MPKYTMPPSQEGLIKEFKILFETYPDVPQMLDQQAWARHLWTMTRAVYWLLLHTDERVE